MYYGIVGIAVVLFSLQFYFNQRFEKENGSGMSAAMVFSALSNLAGVVILLAVNGFRLTVTPFGLLMATIAAVVGLLFTLCSMKALDKINLSLYSIFSMLGGMTLPFVVGIFFYGERFTLGKTLCFVLVAVSLLLTLQKGGGASGWLYYVGIFVLNGMSGVLSKIFNDAPYAKGSAADYSILAALVSVVISALMLCKYKPRRISRGSFLATVGHGVFCRIANWLLLIALVHLPASAQYPMITGGVMICSTLLCCFSADKPKRNEWIAVALSFAGIMALVLLP